MALSVVVILLLLTCQTNAGLFDTYSSGSCSQLPTATSVLQTVTSPGYPSVYSGSTDVCWRIEAGGSSQRVYLTFTDFNVEFDPHCAYDSVQIFRDAGNAYNLLDHLCGYENFGTYVSDQGGALVIRFTTDSTIEYTGFSAQYTTQGNAGDDAGNCDVILVDSDKTTVSSPGYPYTNYTNNYYGCWKFFTDELNAHVYVDISYIDTQYDPVCTPDGLTVRDGSNTESPHMLTYCGHHTDSNVEMSSGHWLFVEFYTDYALTGEGFTLTHSTVPPPSPACIMNYEYAGTYTNITSPNHPNTYPPNSEQCWVVSTDVGSQVQVSFFSFDIEYHVACSYDNLEIRNGGEPYSPFYGIFCGSLLPAPFVSENNSVYFKLLSDSSVEASGFNIGFRKYSSDVLVTLVVNTAEQYFTSANYPSSYDNDVQVCWQLQASDVYSRIVITTQAFSTESVDVVTIFDGSSEYATLLAFWSGSVDDTVVSSGPVALVCFTTDSTIAYTGFRLGYHSIDYSTYAFCTSLYSSTYVQALFSPDYPFEYPANADICWTVQTDSPGYVIRFYIYDMNIEDSASCQVDYMAIHDGTQGSSHLLGRFCGFQYYIVVTTSGQHAYLLFHSDSIIQYSGFHLEFYAIIDDDIGGDGAYDDIGGYGDDADTNLVVIIAGCVSTIVVLLSIIIVISVACWCKKRSTTPTSSHATGVASVAQGVAMPPMQYNNAAYQNPAFQHGPPVAAPHTYPGQGPVMALPVKRPPPPCMHPAPPAHMPPSYPVDAGYMHMQ